MTDKQVVIMRRNYYYGDLPRWQVVRDDRGEPLVAHNAAAARHVVAELRGEVYHLAHGEYSAPDWGYKTPSGRIRRIV